MFLPVSWDPKAVFLIIGLLYYVPTAAENILSTRFDPVLVIPGVGFPCCYHDTELSTQVRNASGRPFPTAQKQRLRTGSVSRSSP